LLSLAENNNAHCCLEVIFRFVAIGGIVDHHCLEVIFRFVDIGGIVDHHCLEVIFRFVAIGGIVDHHCLNFGRALIREETQEIQPFLAI
jgi:hypothetical protein